MDEKFLWAAVAAFGGWIAAQLTAVLKDLTYRFWLKRAIVGELVQLAEETERLWLNYSRDLQIHSLGGISNSIPLPLSNFIFANHYKDAVLAFARPQRIAMQMIHGYIAQLNETASSLHKLVLHIQEQDLREEAIFNEMHKLYGQRIRAALETVGVTRWHIRHYLENPIFPELDFKGKTHIAYVKHVDWIKGDIENTVASVKGLTLDDFKKAYDPKIFGAEEETANA